MLNRKNFLKSIAGTTLGVFHGIPFMKEMQSKKGIKKAYQLRERNDFYVSNRAPLKATPFAELPKGWLLDQLQRQRSGLTGNLDKKYEAVIGQTNGWLGGDGDGWKRGPNWLDGLVPLAYLLNDEELKEKAHNWIEWSLNNQQDDGYFGPIPFDKEPVPIRGVQPAQEDSQTH